MVTTLITAAIAAAITTGVCLWAYRKGKADGAYEAFRERSLSSDLLPLMALGTMAGFGKGFTPNYNAPKDDDVDKLLNALKDEYMSCPCKQQENSSQS